MNLILAWPVREGSGLRFELSSYWFDLSINATQPPSDKSEQAAHPSRTLGDSQPKEETCDGATKAAEGVAAPTVASGHPGRAGQRGAASVELGDDQGRAAPAPEARPDSTLSD